jgi:pimeloyl-ACP methyl ester carboxylesterase
MNRFAAAFAIWFALAGATVGCVGQPAAPRPEKGAQESMSAPVIGNGSYATVNGLKMYYEVHGSGRPLVLLHGAFGLVETWAGVLPALAKTHQVILVEQQGHGHTADRDAPLTYEQMADDTAALLKQLNAQPADIFGYSMGGITALGIAIRHPEAVGRLAVLGANTGNVKDVFEPEAYAQFRNLPDDFAPEPLKQPYDRVAPDKSKWPVLVRKLKSLGLDFEGYSNEQIGSIQAPTLILLGDHEGIRPEHAVEMFRRIPNAQLAIFPGADHFLLFSSPQKVLGTLLPFLDAPVSDATHEPAK